MRGSTFWAEVSCLDLWGWDPVGATFAVAGAVTGAVLELVVLLAFDGVYNCKEKKRYKV